MAKCLGSLLGLLAAIALCGGCGRDRHTDGRMTVVASIAPLASLTREVGGDRIHVELFVRPGQNPHVFEPTGEQMKALSRAKVLVLNGLALEYWADKAVKGSGNSDLLVVDSSEGITAVDDEDAGSSCLWTSSSRNGCGHSHSATERSRGAGHPAGNPHVWLDPLLAARQVENICEGLCRADPGSESYYRSRASRLTARLRELDVEIRSEVDSFSTRDFITFHPSWIYFAHRYGLRQAAAIEEFPGKEPSAAYIREVIDVARQVGTRAIFAEPQFPSSAVKVVADECGARVLMLDPMGVPPDYDYFETMRKAVSTMKEAMR